MTDLRTLLNLLKITFLEFDLKIDLLILKVTLNHKHNTIKWWLTIQNPFQNEILHMFLALFGKNLIFDYLTLNSKLTYDIEDDLKSWK